MDTLVIQVLNSLFYASILFLIACGLTLVYGVMHHAAVASGRPTPPDRPRPCDAIGNLLQRYPGSREWFAGRECAPA